MKTFMVKYTEDFGATYHTVLISAASFTEAYVAIDMRLPEFGAIIDLFEII